jgi:TolA-binding protein
MDDDATTEAAPNPTPNAAPAEAPAPAKATRRAVAPRTRSAAAQQLAAANRARQQGQIGKALKLYRGLRKQFPRAIEAPLTWVSEGRLLLDHQRRPGAAARAFERYLAQHASGPLAHEAMVGRALAFEALGHKQREQRAWQALLQRFPETLLATRAKARLQTLSDAIDP